MPAPPPFTVKPTLTGGLVVLRPVRTDDAADALRMVSDRESCRLTGTHATFTLDQLERWYGTRGDHDDRLGLTVVERALHRGRPRTG